MENKREGTDIILYSYIILIIVANDVTDDNIICLLESQFIRVASFSMCHIYLGRKKEKPRGILLSFHFE